jgi:hypothetical protein
MALGLGEGGEQNAPLGRAVIGGLIFATAATLFFVSHGLYAGEQNETSRNAGCFCRDRTWVEQKISKEKS